MVKHMGPDPKQGHYVSYMLGSGPTKKYNDRGSTNPFLREAEEQFQKFKPTGYIYYYRKHAR